MKEQNKVSAECRECHTALPVNHSGPCPTCGKTQTKQVNIHFLTGVKAKVNVNLLKEKYFRKIMWLPLLLAVLATLGSSVVGYFICDIKGFVISLGLNLVSIYFWYIALVKAWHGEQWHYE